MQSILLKQGTVIGSSGRSVADVLIEGDTISRVAPSLSVRADREIDCEGKLIFPGMIDTHVHFRDPGLTAKGDALTESRAAVAGGVTTVCDMPNTVPNTTSLALVKQKQAIYAKKCLCNFGIYIGATRDNLDELKEADLDPTIPAIKIFMAESTGEMTIPDDESLEPIFRETTKLIAVHAENEFRRLERLDALANGKLPEVVGLAADDPYLHAVVRDNQTAAEGTAKAVALATAYLHRTHILHMSAKEELPFLEKGVDSGLVTGETCPHYLLFDREDLKTKGTAVLMNPALKGAEDREALWQALRDGLISQVATDHAPHLREEKARPYPDAPAGLPGVQFALPLLLHAVFERRLRFEDIARLYAEAPARNYAIADKGYVREGFDADITIVDPTAFMEISDAMVESRCGWTPYAGMRLEGGSVWMTIVNGRVVFENGKVRETGFGTSIRIEG
ncbi:MAG: dihydroorotase [Patescibacteria group bacterium]|nr:dihydroorotase [Patescibacteria group bacterium]